MRFGTDVETGEVVIAVGISEVRALVERYLATMRKLPSKKWQLHILSSESESEVVTFNLGGK